MAGTLIEDYTGDGRSSSTEELPSDQQSHSGESLAEWRSSEQVENGTPSTSPAYSDSDDDDCGSFFNSLSYFLFLLNTLPLRSFHTSGYCSAGLNT
uniref:Uncharacterized protein n=1 Tax=Oryza nivara TaxID=4536 RepID=A0A0E0JBZ5_ORYNI